MATRSRGDLMFTRLFLIALLLTTLIAVASAQPNSPRTRMQFVDGDLPWVGNSGQGLNKAAVDTFYLLGGPDRLDGKFEDEVGAPNWHGWTHRDLTVSKENHWHVSTYWAAGLNGHGPGNSALVCVDENIPACAASDTVGGVGDHWFDEIQWQGTVSDPLVPVTVRLTAYMHYDLADIDWDFLELWIKRGDGSEMLGQWTGTDYEVALDISTVLQPAELQGTGSDEVHLFWRVWSDLGYNDVDCLSPSHGAAQIDDISIYFNDALMGFYDFESGMPSDWVLQEFSGIGDFAKLRSNLPDPDPCRQNGSVQVTFIDDGLIVPGAGPTMCQTHCYGLGGFILNNTGGLLSEDTQRDWFLKNAILSPPVAWIAGAEAAELAFDVFRHELFLRSGAGIFYTWDMRSTTNADPAELEYAPWQSAGTFFYGGPDYFRHHFSVGDKIVADARWAQVRIVVDEAGWLWNLNGTDGTPAPYFDNVSLKGWAAQGPEILVSGRDNFADSFPEQGLLDPLDLGSNWCRLDSPRNLTRWEPVFVAGDSLVAEIGSQRPGAEISGAPQIHWAMDCNPVFDAARPSAPNGDGILRGSLPGYEVFPQTGFLNAKWAFDLPDTGWFYPGDRVRYYITAADLVNTEVKTSVWPADTTGVLDFTTDSRYPGFAEVRALPSLSMPSAGVFDQPDLFYCDDAGNQDNTDRMLRSLAELGFVPGVDFDHYRSRYSGSFLDSGFGASGTVATLSGYQTFLVDAGTNFNSSLAGTTESGEVALFDAWLDLGDKRALLMGDNLLRGMNFNASGLIDRLGVFFSEFDISTPNGGHRDLQITALDGNGILPDGSTWVVNANCPVLRYVDAVLAGPTGVALAGLNPAGSPGGEFAAALAQTDVALSNKIGVLPFSFPPVQTDHDNPVVGEPNYSARTLLLKHFLDWFAVAGTGAPSAVPEARGFSFQVGPNPFNPRTTVEFELPRSVAVTLDIYDVQGRRVKQLLNETMAAGPHSQAWNGRDAKNRQAPSGIYFYRFTAGDQRRQGKLTLLK
jgi:FlgD Ig-like domain